MKLHRNQKYFKWGLTAFLVIVAAVLFWIVFSNLSGFYNLVLDFFGIISPIIFGFLFAYLMNPVMTRAARLLRKLGEKRKWKEKTVERVSRVGGLVTSLLVLLLSLYAFFAMIIPSLVSSLQDLLQPDRLEGYYQTVSDWADSTFSDTPVEEWFESSFDSFLHFLTDQLKSINIGALFSGLTSSVFSVVMFVFNALVGIVAAVYLLIYKKELLSHSKKVTVAVFNPAHADRLFEIGRRMNRIFSGFVIGKIIDAILVGVITYIGMLVMGLPYAPLIATIVGVTNIIPFFGPFIGAVPSAILLLIENPMNAIYFVIFILVVQMIDGNIIENRILGEKLGISDFWVLTAILVFGGIFGFGGMLLGVPVFAVIYSLIADAVNKRLRSKHLPTQSDLYYTMRCVNDLPAASPTSYSYVATDPAYDVQAEDEDDVLDEYDD